MFLTVKEELEKWSSSRISELLDILDKALYSGQIDLRTEDDILDLQEFTGKIQDRIEGVCQDLAYLWDTMHNDPEEYDYLIERFHEDHAE